MHPCCIMSFGEKWRRIKNCQSGWTCQKCIKMSLMKRKIGQASARTKPGATQNFLQRDHDLVVPTLHGKSHVKSVKPKQVWWKSPKNRCRDSEAARREANGLLPGRKKRSERRAMTIRWTDEHDSDGRCELCASTGPKERPSRPLKLLVSLKFKNHLDRFWACVSCPHVTARYSITCMKVVHAFKSLTITVCALLTFKWCFLQSLQKFPKSKKVTEPSGSVRPVRPENKDLPTLRIPSSTRIKHIQAYLSNITSHIFLMAMLVFRFRIFW